VVRHVYGSQLWPTQHSRTALQVLDALSDGNRTLRG
jgi:hypothetical protein